MLHLCIIFRTYTMTMTLGFVKTHSVSYAHHDPCHSTNPNWPPYFSSCATPCI